MYFLYLQFLLSLSLETNSITGLDEGWKLNDYYKDDHDEYIDLERKSSNDHEKIRQRTFEDGNQFGEEYSYQMTWHN